MLAFKLILVPLIIAAVSWAGRRWGPAVSGWLVGLPLTSGPVVFFLALEQGRGFASRAAQGAMLGLISLSTLCVVYGWVAVSRGWFLSVLAAWSTFLVMTYCLKEISISLLLTFLITAAIMGVAYRIMPESPETAPPPNLPRWEIPVRMGVATVMLLVITGLANSLGPRLSGLLTTFPVVTTVIGVFTHHFEGGRAVTRLLRGLIAGLFTFAAFFIVIASTISTWGLIPSFALAAGAGMVVHGCSLWVIREQISHGRIVLTDEDL